MTLPNLLTYLSFSILFVITPTLAQSTSEILCNSTEWPDVCPTISDPVCVPEPKQCITTPCFQTADVSSPCEACKRPNVESYTPGRCEYLCEAGNLPPSILDTRDNPVCGNYQANCQVSSCRDTFRRSTVACANSNVVSFSLGACPEDEWEVADIIEWELLEEYANEEEYVLEEGQLEEGQQEESQQEEQEEEEAAVEEEEEEAAETGGIPEIVLSCGTPRPTGCPDTIAPVCVTQCLSGRCRYTASSGCIACQDPNVLAYSPGACEAQRVQCQPSNVPPTEVVCVGPLNPVCAYTLDCTAEPCGITAGNVCEACDLLRSDYYIAGPCPI